MILIINEILYENRFYIFMDFISNKNMNIYNDSK